MKTGNAMKPKRKRKRRLLSTDITLADHQRKGSKLIAPMNALVHNGQLTLTHWRFDRLPEVIWVAELLHHLGPLTTKSVLPVLLKAADMAEATKTGLSPLCARTWTIKSQPFKQFCCRELRSAGLLEKVERSLATLRVYYPEYPTPLVDLPVASHAEPLTAFKERLRPLLDRFTHASTRLHIALFFASVNSGFLRIPPEMTPERYLRAIDMDEAPADDTEYEMAASSARAMSMSLFSMVAGNGSVSTGPYFWSRGLVLERCEGRG